MALGGLSKALITISKAKGWDPTVIRGTGESIANFDKAPELFTNESGTGTLPNNPAASGQKDPSEGPVLGQRVSFSVPDASRETKNRATKGANPFPGGITG